jgi:hypothetical protein
VARWLSLVLITLRISVIFSFFCAGLVAILLNP